MENVIHQKFELAGPRDAVIRGDVRIETITTGRQPTIVICHGFKGFKDWGSFPYIAEKLAFAGFGVVSFNFSHNGVGEDLENFTELDRFKENTFSLEQEDLRLLLAAMREKRHAVFDVLNTERIGLVGHSRGGIAVLSVGVEHDDVGSIVTLASIAGMPHLEAEEEQEWREAGVRFILNARTGQQLPMGIGLLAEIKEVTEKLQDTVTHLQKPLLVIHGDADQSVNVSSADQLCSWAPQATKVILEGADHTFGARHPFEGTTPHLERVIELIARFFNDTFASTAKPA